MSVILESQLPVGLEFNIFLQFTTEPNSLIKQISSPKRRDSSVEMVQKKMVKKNRKGKNQEREIEEESETMNSKQVGPGRDFNEDNNDDGDMDVNEEHVERSGDEKVNHLLENVISSKKKKKKISTFASMGLSDGTLKAIRKMGYQFPTPIQRMSIPVSLTGRDVVAMAKTGSGKTAAFVIPMLERLKEHSKKVGVRALIIAPSRELILQSFKFVKEIGRFSDLQTCVLVGGKSMDNQFEYLAQNPDIIVATPGRLLHIIAETGLSLKMVEYVVFDEGDKLFEMGLKEQLFEILGKLPKERQTLLVSATLPSVLADFVKVGLRDPEFIRLDADTKISDDLGLAFFHVRSQEKDASLIYLLREVIPPHEQTIVFTCTRHHCEYLHDLLDKAQIPSVVIYGSMDQEARQNNLHNFKIGKSMVLIVTDVAARGIDVPSLDYVVNYDFPPKPKIFIHRVGRVARAGRQGTAFSLVTLEDIPYMIDLHMFLGRPIKSKIQEIANENDPNMSIYSLKVIIKKCDGYYGLLPNSLIDHENAEVVRILKEHPEIESEKKSCDRAYKLYCETRAKPSKSSLARCKNVERDIHPLFIWKFNVKSQSSCDIVEQNQLLEQIVSYRPHATIFEMGTKGTDSANLMKERRTFKSIGDIYKTTSQNGHNTISTNDDDDDAYTDEEDDDDDDDDNNDDNNDENDDDDEKISNIQQDSEEKQKIKANKQKNTKMNTQDHEKSQTEMNGIEKKKLLSKLLLKRTSAILETEERDKFRDKKNYISYEPSGTNMFDEAALGVDSNLNEDDERSAFRDPFQDATLDLTPEDKESILKNRTFMKWDKKKKRYIQVNSMDQKQGILKLKNESGALVKKDDKLDAYQKWKKRTKARIQRPGEIEVDQTSLKPMTFEEELESVMRDGQGSQRGGRKRKGREREPSEGRKRKATEELKSKEQIKKQRKEKQKQDEVSKIRDEMKKKGVRKVKERIHTEGMIKAINKRQDQQRYIVAGQKKKNKRRR